ncbi:alkaline phosphatase [Rhizobium sp. R339]|uniref:BREX-1 system phosphatase PglZ type A n=1 Tax=Rhizobium sp. R339 TaxID=1764273 RepID=UPI000B52EC43|nr:BREX-1 system phosphatase PglZ type A [Rhizobium sp. R339]OWV68075.1 alkaline phosphatase [Rhizobium sp. R339]
MSDRVTATLTRLFADHRIVFWYDGARDMRDVFDAAVLSKVTKLEIANNEFGLKYQMLKQNPDQKFLLYRDGPEPPMEQNWLLDIQLAAGIFKADRVSDLLLELGFPPRFDPVIRDHTEFYKSRGRVEALKQATEMKDMRAVRRRMLAICANASGGLDTVVEALLADMASEKDERIKLIERSNLSEFLWDELGRVYGYAAANPSVEDLALTLFKSCYRIALGETGSMNAEAVLLFRRWKNDRNGAIAFEVLSERYADVLGIEQDLGKHDFRHLLGLDYFEAVDRQVIRQVVHALSTQTASPPDVMRWIRERRQSHWYDRYADIYQAIDYAAQFQLALAEATLGMTNAAEGFRKYAATWFRIDQLYRKFVYHMQKSGQQGLLGELFNVIENRYSTSYLLAVNDAWQDQIAKMSDWQIPGAERQIEFYRREAAQYRRKDQKVAVIISDALRYEVADELLSRIKGLNRFDADLTAMLGVLPSYTQLGMASLLPNKALRIAEDDTALVFETDLPTQGLAAREKVLSFGREGDRVKALKVEDVAAMRVDEGKELFREHDVVYIYHNRIDAIGDNRTTEEDLPKAVEATLEEIVTLVRKLTSANFSNILITADHGFLYQHRALEESDYSQAEIEGGTVLARTRRFVLGTNLPETPGMKKFTAQQLGLAGTVEALIPNSINRLRLKGSGSRYVHGGASLQEVVVPLLRVGKKREADLGQVEVQVITAGKNQITSGQIALVFYQAQAVTEKMLPRELRVGFYSESGELISDEFDLVFDIRADNPRDREITRKFLFSRVADKYNNQDVFLKLRERVGKTSHFQDYGSQRFQLKRGIAADFDF